jgi:hypothetical protein
MKGSSMIMISDYKGQLQYVSVLMRMENCLKKVILRLNTQHPLTLLI